MPIQLAFDGFWPGFDAENNFFVYIFEQIGVDFELSSTQDADLVIESVFKNTRSHLFSNIAKRKQKRWFFTGENVRPEFRNFEVCLSFDYIENSNHFRLPLWFLYCDFSLDGEANHKADSQLNPYLFHKPRSLIDWSPAKKLSVYVGNMTSTRRQIIDKFSEKMEVVCYGSAFGNPVESKISHEGESLFTMCFENTYFPGYHTEKLPQAWAMKSLPLYFGAKTVSRDFNDNAYLNLVDFRNLDFFVEYISGLSTKQVESVVSQPLTNKPVDLDAIRSFFKRGLEISGL